MIETLTERQKLILALVVREYVDTAEPVSSGRLVKNYRLDFSSATVRNEMAVLTDYEYLQQPYTSAGRIPTRVGYRFFVQQLMGPAELPSHIQQMIRHQFYQARHDVDDWLSLSASVLANHTQGASLVTALHMDEARLNHVALLATRGRQVLLVYVLEGGEVRQQTLVFEEQIPQHRLSGIAENINQDERIKDIQTLRVLIEEAEDEVEHEVLSVILEEIEDTDLISTGNVYRDGLTNVLSEPEFTDPAAAQKTLRLFEDRSVLDDLLSKTIFERDSSGVQIIIGGEGNWEELKNCSVILAPYGTEKHSLGAVGVIGPMRMSYSRGVSAVRFVSDLMSELLTETVAS
ncbi:MAG: heat-inducible transcriptional repressor HrcA [Anaerolineales bacterium]